jgi:hypothetical protein
MQLNDLLRLGNIDPKKVLVMRHRPTEPELRKVLPWLAAEKPDVFNAYQQTQHERAEGALSRAQYVASFIGHEAGKATFVGLYKVGKSRPLSFKQYWKIPAFIEMKSFGMVGFRDRRPSILWFELKLLDFYEKWKGKLIVRWPPPERAWWRWSGQNTIIIDAILSESRLSRGMPDWNEIVLTWDELRIIPSTWRERLSQWRGIYLIFDAESEKAYVGSAYGRENILGRWANYAARAHGGNKKLRDCDPAKLRFSILQRVSPDMESADVIRLEASWKSRLLTREFGLNEN